MLRSLQCRAMKICHYNEHEAGLVEGERVHPIGPALIGAGHLRQGYTMQEVIGAQALEHVFGYTICWDISQREPWGRNRQNTRNIRKGFDTFTALGPWIVTRDELAEPQDTRIHVELNGKHVMTAHTRDMICGVRDHIRFLSAALTLRPGDLITTGTPAGVAKLAPGDKLKGRIERIGEMTLGVEGEK